MRGSNGLGRGSWWWPLAAVILVLATGCSAKPGSDGEAGAEAGAASFAGAGGLDVAPDFELPDLSGSPVRLADSAGRVRLIDFWATWCPPCRDEIPMLNELHRAYGEAGLTILAISDEKADVVREFADEAGMDYTNLIDPGEVSESYRVLGLPTAFLVDREGQVVDFYVGPKSRKQLEEKIRELLELAPAAPAEG